MTTERAPVTKKPVQTAGAACSINPQQALFFEIDSVATEIAPQQRPAGAAHTWRFIMSLTRRRFLETASLTLVATTALPRAFAQPAGSLKADPFSPENQDFIENASEETFKPLIGESFAVMKGTDQVASLTLLSVAKPAPLAASDKQPSAPVKVLAAPSPRIASAAITGFVLHFKSASRQTLPQATYTLTNRSVGSFALFLTPSDPSLNPQEFAAAFSLLPL